MPHPVPDPAPGQSGASGAVPGRRLPVGMEAARAELLDINAFFGELALASPNIEFRQIQSGSLFCEITMLDDFAMYVPYMNAERHNDLPLWEVSRRLLLYGVLEGELEFMWNANVSAVRKTLTTPSVDPAPRQ